jgi:hypothetical protein
VIRSPGAAQHEVVRRRSGVHIFVDPGSAAHRYALRCIRETPILWSRKKIDSPAAMMIAEDEQAQHHAPHDHESELDRRPGLVPIAANLYVPTKNIATCSK